MTTLRQAAQQALEALEAFLSDELRPYEAAKTAVALRAALAEPVQEPQPLTEEEIEALDLPPSGTATVRDLVRLIERAHGIT